MLDLNSRSSEHMPQSAHIQALKPIQIARHRAMRRVICEVALAAVAGK